MAFTSNILALGLAAAAGVAAQPGQWRGQGQSAGSPAYNYMFQNPLPIPAVAVPEFTETFNGRSVQFYTSTVEPFTKQVYPNLGPAHMTGYNGTAPGPTYLIPRGTETIIRYLNKGDVSAAVHLHGSYTHSVWDGWASDEVQVGQWKDYYYPNSETARPIWYHDHAYGHTASDAYYGQAGVYIITDSAEDVLGLPSGKYDVPLTLADKKYQSNGDLASPNGNPINFFGDILEVNGQPWPYMSVEPRKYRFRLFDMSLSRMYDVYFADNSGNWIPFQVIGSDSGLFGSPVSTSDVLISMGERYEVVFDFSKYAGQNITLGNNNQQQQIQEYANTNKLMKFVVGNSVSDNSNNGDVPSVLNGNIQWPAQRTVVDHTFNFQMGGESTWTINGVDFNDVNNRILARPPQGTVQLWELHHTGGPAVHPVHVHLVNLQVVSRTGGSRGVLPYEAAGLKDVVLLEPGETVRVLAYFGPENGVYMFHCHNLIHEDHTMMDAFNVTYLQDLGYSSAIDYADPMNKAFAAQDYSDSAFSPAAKSSAASSLANLGAYSSFAALQTAEAKFYVTAGYNGDSSVVAATTTVAPSSSGYGFASTTVTGPSTAATAVATNIKGRPFPGPPGGPQNGRPTGRPGFAFRA
ncbi:hypothetical protein LTR78_005176 [Recurvomyces mirabilis]|uniref:Cupredoxin n=1 Tax=Recurvomyces mirabilis TaxID=574656 RepID=A0AAE1C1J2_9PEZI|nr:hypothetical protein LTR78_005176 [Recurvomyces mirabilis]KAK5157726.1 hypothetical protein LTS14_003648 [Recurvomyces mirabilis]